MKLWRKPMSPKGGAVVQFNVCRREAAQDAFQRDVQEFYATVCGCVQQSVAN
jgi:hypothetical protein